MSNKVNKETEVVEEVAPEVVEPVAGVQLEDIVAQMAGVMAKLAEGKDTVAPEVHVDVNRQKRKRSPKRQAALEAANKRNMERVEFMVPEPADDKEAARGFTTINHNGKTYQIMFGIKVLIPKCVAESYYESERLKNVAIQNRRQILKNLAKNKGRTI